MTAVAVRITDLVAFEVKVAPLDVQPDSLAAQGGDVLDASCDADARASRRHAAVIGHNGDLARTVVDLVQLQRAPSGRPTIG